MATNWDAANAMRVRVVIVRRLRHARPTATPIAIAAMAKPKYFQNDPASDDSH